MCSEQSLVPLKDLTQLRRFVCEYKKADDIICEETKLNFVKPLCHYCPRPITSSNASTHETFIPHFIEINSEANTSQLRENINQNL